MTQIAGRNPYRPDAATRPLFLAGRDPERNRFTRILNGSPELPANVRLTGLRGVGKTVLLREYEDIAKSQGWLTARTQVEPRHNDEESLSDLIADISGRAVERASSLSRAKAKAGAAITALRGALTVTYEDLTFSLAGMDKGTAAISQSLLAATEASVKAGAPGFALLLDEAQVLFDEKARDGQHPLSMLIAAVNVLQEAQVPLALVLCGLPTLRAKLQKARTYSERMFRSENIGALQGNPGPARDAFLKPLEGTGMSATEGLTSRVLQEVEGYPFFIQLWGAELWDAAQFAQTRWLSEELLDDIEKDIYRRLDEEFYAGRVDTLTPSEQDLLLGTAECSYPPLRTSDVQSISTKSVSNINVLMGRLVEQGVLFRIQKGQYEYTAPKFHAYLQRRRESDPYSS